MNLRKIRIRKKTHGWRIVEAPDEPVKAAQRLILNQLKSDEASQIGYGTAKGMGLHKALHKFQKNLNEGFQWIASVDIKNCFPSINPKKPLAMIDTRVCDGVPGLYGRKSLPQGHPISPSLSNVYMSQFDDRVQTWQTIDCLSDSSTTECRVIRYVDNIWLMCREKCELEFYLSLSLSYLGDLGFTPRVESFKHVNQGIDFLGYKVTRWSIGPTPRNIERFKDKCMKYALKRKELEEKLRIPNKEEPTEEIQAEIGCLDRKFKEFLTGWESYFGPAMRPWQGRFLLGLNIDIPCLTSIKPLPINHRSQGSTTANTALHDQSSSNEGLGLSWND